MKTSFKLTISRPCGGKNDIVSMDVESYNGSVRLRFDIDKADFVDALTGQGYMKTRIGDIYGSLDNLHKYEIHRHKTFKLPREFNYKSQDEEIYKELMLLPEVQEMIKDGWHFSSYFNSQGQVSLDYDTKVTTVHAHISKWVEFDQVEKEDKLGFNFAENEQHAQEMKDLEKA